MSQASKPVGSVGRAQFELDRFELVGGDRFELEGRWFGVRGRRFMRPALTLVVDGQPTRLLADLADKPWAAEDGEPWNAAFPFALEGGELLDAELTVAPDITVTLPLPAAQIVAGKMKPRAARTRRSPSAAGHSHYETTPWLSGAPRWGRETKPYTSATRCLPPASGCSQSSPMSSPLGALRW